MNITLKNMFGARAPEVTSVIADTKEKAVAVAKALLDGEEATLEEQDGLFIARKSGSKPDANERVIHLGKTAGVAYTISNIQKELVLYDMEGENFDEAVKQEGFVPGLMIGMEALHTTIRNMAMSEDTSSPEAFREKAAKAIEDFGAYVDSLIGALPQKAFKFEKALVAHAPNVLTPSSARPTEGFDAEVYDAIFGKPPVEVAAVPDTTAEKPAEAEAATTTTEAPATAEAPAEAPKDAGSAHPATQEAGKEGEEASAADPAPANFEQLPLTEDEKARAETDPSAVLASALEELTKNIGTQIAAAVAPIKETVASQGDAISKLSKAVGGTVASTPEEDDNVVTLSKGAAARDVSGGGEPPLIDTAYRTQKQG